MKRRNDHPAPCFKCRNMVLANEGWVYPGQDEARNWRVYHDACDSKNGTAPASRKKDVLDVIGEF